MPPFLQWRLNFLILFLMASKCSLISVSMPRVDQTIAGITNWPVFSMLNLLVNDNRSNDQHYRNSKLCYNQNFAGNGSKLANTECSFQHFQWLKRRKIKSRVTAGKQSGYQNKSKIENQKTGLVPGNCDFFARHIIKQRQQ